MVDEYVCASTTPAVFSEHKMAPRKKKNLPSLVRYFCQTTPHTRLRKHDTTHGL